MAVVLSCVQGAPNDLSRLHVEEVGLKDVLNEIGSVAPGVEVEEGLGPTMQVYMGNAGGWWTAQFGWLDAQGDEIRNAFFNGAHFPENLLLNKAYGPGSRKVRSSTDIRQ